MPSAFAIENTQGEHKGLQKDAPTNGVESSQNSPIDKPSKNFSRTFALYE